LHTRPRGFYEKRGFYENRSTKREFSKREFSAAKKGFSAAKKEFSADRILAEWTGVAGDDDGAVCLEAVLGKFSKNSEAGFLTASEKANQRTLDQSRGMPCIPDEQEKGSLPCGSLETRRSSDRGPESRTKDPFFCPALKTVYERRPSKPETAVSNVLLRDGPRRRPLDSPLDGALDGILSQPSLTASRRPQNDFETVVETGSNQYRAGLLMLQVSKRR
jgi:hypothetical protein